jgi:hypothetical protein
MNGARIAAHPEPLRTQRRNLIHNPIKSMPHGGKVDLQGCGSDIWIDCWDS